MSDGPFIIYDKSTIQALNPAEVFCLDHHYRINIIPIFFSEVLSDLSKTSKNNRSPESIVGSIAAKISGFSAMPNMHHLTLCLGDFLGHAIETRGAPVISGGRIVTASDGTTGMFVDEPPEIAAMRRWSEGDFFGVERDYAKAWREGLNVQDLEGIVAAIRPPGKPPLRNLEELKLAVDVMAAGHGSRHKTLKLALAMLSIPSQFHPQIIARWKASGGPPLNVFAPYADHIFRVDLFFYFGMAAGLIAATRSSHRIDIAYLYYLPFCTIFSSFDKFHIATAPHFLDHERQIFVPGADLKADLAALARYYGALPPEIRAKGAMTYAAYPPRTGDFLTSRIFDRFNPGWREAAANPVDLTPENSRRLMEHLKPMLDAIEASKLKS